MHYGEWRNTNNKNGVCQETRKKQPAILDFAQSWLTILLIYNNFLPILISLIQEPTVAMLWGSAMAGQFWRSRVDFIHRSHIRFCFWCLFMKFSFSISVENVSFYYWEDSVFLNQRPDWDNIKYRKLFW